MANVSLQAETSSYIFEKKSLAFYFSWSRLAILAICYVSALMLQLMQGDFLSVEVWQPLNVIMAIAFLLHLIYLETLEATKISVYATRILFVFDLIAIFCFMSVLGFFQPLFLFLSLIAVSASALLLGRASALNMALLAVSLFNLLLALKLDIDHAISQPIWLLTNFSYLIVAGLSGAIGEQFETASQEIETKRSEVESLTNINDLIVENVPSGLLIVDQQMQIVFANRGAAKIFSDLALVGKAVKEIFSELDEVLTSQNFEITKNKSNQVIRIELNYHNLKKEKLILETLISKISPKPGVVQFLCLIQNLTEVKNLEIAMRQKEKLAAVGALAAGIAHEIRNPLASISGSVQLLQGQLQTQTTEDKKLLAIMVREIDRLNRLVTEFLDYVRPDIRTEDPVNLNSLMKEVIEVAKLNTALSQKVEHRTELFAKGIVLGHYDKLKQAMLNIVINAYQAMSDTLRPELYVQTYDSEGKVVLVIRDNGMGMTRETQKRLFEPFHTTKPKGTGLGLAITHKILESHEAQVTIESELGQGAKFIIVFKAHDMGQDNKEFFRRQA